MKFKRQILRRCLIKKYQIFILIGILEFFAIGSLAYLIRTYSYGPRTVVADIPVSTTTIQQSASDPVVQDVPQESQAQLQTPTTAAPDFPVGEYTAYKPDAEPIVIDVSQLTSDALSRAVKIGRASCRERV